MLELKAVLVCLLWALCYPLISIALSESPPLHLAFLRSMLAGVSLLLMSLGGKGLLIPQDWQSWRGILIVGFGYTSLGFGGMFLAGGAVSPGLATVVSNSQPIIAVVLAYIFAVERVKMRQFMALAIGLAGIVVIVLPALHHEQANLTGGGIGFVLLGAFGVALGNVWMKKISPDSDILRLSAWQLIVGSIPLRLGAFIMEDPRTIVWSSQLLLSLTILAIPGTAVATFMWFHILRVGQLHRMNAFTLLTPLFALTIGALFFNERLDANETLGTAIIIGALVLTNTGKSRR